MLICNWWLLQPCLLNIQIVGFLQFVYDFQSKLQCSTIFVLIAFCYTNTKNRNVYGNMSAFGSKDSKQSLSLNKSVHFSYQDLKYCPLSCRLKTEQLLTLSHKAYRGPMKYQSWYFIILFFLCSTHFWRKFADLLHRAIQSYHMHQAPKQQNKTNKCKTGLTKSLVALWAGTFEILVARKEFN